VQNFPNVQADYHNLEEHSPGFDNFILGILFVNEGHILDHEVVYHVLGYEEHSLDPNSFVTDSQVIEGDNLGVVNGSLDFHNFGGCTLVLDWAGNFCFEVGNFDSSVVGFHRRIRYRLGWARLGK